MSFGYQAQQAESIPVDTGSGWPALSTGEFRQHRRIPEQFEEQVIADSLERSCGEVQLQLIQVVSSQGTDAPFTLNAASAPDFSAQQNSIYRAAVYSRSHADLLGYFSAVDQKPSGNNKAQDVDQQDALLAQSNRAVRQLLGRGRCGVHSL